MVLLAERVSKFTLLLTIFAERTDDKTPNLKQPRVGGNEPI
jgi:hypothetical protein